MSNINVSENRPAVDNTQLSPESIAAVMRELRNIHGATADEVTMELLEPSWKIGGLDMVAGLEVRRAIANGKTPDAVLAWLRNHADHGTDEPTFDERVCCAAWEGIMDSLIRERHFDVSSEHELEAVRAYVYDLPVAGSRCITTRNVLQLVDTLVWMCSVRADCSNPVLVAEDQGGMLEGAARAMACNFADTDAGGSIETAQEFVNDLRRFASQGEA